MSSMDAEERLFWVWLSIFTIVLATAPFAYWQGYHLSGIVSAIMGLGGLFMLIRDRIAETARKWPRVSLKVLAVVALSLIVSQLIGRDIAGYRASEGLSPTQWFLYGVALLLVAVVLSAVFSKRKPSKLAIHWANYRAVEDGGDVYEVGDFLRQIISGDSLVFDIENHNFRIGKKNFVENDPFPFKEKRLQVNYSFGGSQPVTTERREHGRLLLPEDSKIKWLMGEVERLTNAQAMTSCAADALTQSKVLGVLPIYFQDLQVKLLASHTGTTLDFSKATLFLKLSFNSDDDTGIRDIKVWLTAEDGTVFVRNPLDDLSDWILQAPFKNDHYPYKTIEEKPLETASLWRDLQHNGLKAGLVKVGWIGVQIPYTKLPHEEVSKVKIEVNETPA